MNCKLFFFFTLLNLQMIHGIIGQDAAKLFDLYQSSHHIEKVYVNTDKSFYMAGDTVWCKAYFVDGRTHTFFEASPILHIEWINKDLKIIKSIKTKIKDGISLFQFPTNEPGQFTIRAYTRYQRNFDPAFIFQKSIHVIGDSAPFEQGQRNDTDYSVQFFPEGGEFIAGLKNKMAFEALDIDGNSINVSGNIVDDKNNIICSFKSFNNGLGFFEITPLLGTHYSAVIKQDGQSKAFKLPLPKETGCLLSVSARSLDFLTINVFSTTRAGLKNYRLIAHSQGSIVLDLALEDGNKKSLKISRTDIPTGIIHITLFDSQNRPICERLSFNKNPNEEVQVTMTLDKEDYQKREEVKVYLQSFLQDISIESDASVSVYNSDIIPEGNNELTIENYLLLQSDIPTTIENVNQYFLKNDTKTNILLDNVMLTKGWRRFSWNDIVAKNKPVIEFDTEENISVIGRILKTKTDEPVKADVYLNTLTADNFASYDMTTEDDGVFYFAGFNFTDTTDLIIQANVHNPKKKKNKNKDEVKRVGKKNVDIEMLALDPLQINSAFFVDNKLREIQQFETIKQEFRNSQHYEQLYNPDWSIDLEEVTVKALRKTEKEKKLSDLEELMSDRNMIYVSGSQKIFLEDLPGGGSIYQDIFQIIRQRVAGAQVRGEGSERYVVLRGINSIQEVTQAAFFLDGVPVNNIASLSIDPRRILAIDVIRGLSAASLYGSSANGGVISLITKDPGAINVSKTKKAKGTINIQHPGYYQAREFYKPSYAKKSIENERPDLRSTLLWEGNLKLADKPSLIQFYTGDKSGNFSIKVEGISKTGHPFVDIKPLVIK